MSELTIKTNNQWRNFLYGYELTDREKQDFDWMEPEELDSAPFARYRNRLYALDEFMRIDENAPFPGDWDGYHSDSFFSGVLIKISKCGDMYKIATYMS